MLIPNCLVQAILRLGWTQFFPHHQCDHFYIFNYFYQRCFFLAYLVFKAFHIQGLNFFEDFFRFEFLAQETVGIGDVGRVEDPVAVGAADGCRTP